MSAIAVFTSGGDAPGMNAVVRAVVRLAIHHGREAFVIYEGYQGMVDGGDMIKQFTWKDTSLIIHQGGTVIGSARCMEFRERSGRLKACKNLVDRNITNLVCCGGDGSLTGANMFKLEWSSLLEELNQAGDITEEQMKACWFLNIVGCVGSIDNDMVYKGGVTIGTDTALNRIIDAIDAVQSTASSHQRTCVLEIMGRNCGYLAWAAGVATGADFIFIPESPPKEDDWESALCDHLNFRRRAGARLCTVLVAEGAIDKFGNAIKTDYVRQVIVDRLKHDTRATILGHVQRGGHASAYDRLLGTMIGAMCVEKLRRTEPGDAACIVGLRGFRPVYSKLEEAVSDTQAVAEFTKNLDFKGAIGARGKGFKKHVGFLKAINRDKPKVSTDHNSKAFVILCCGAPASGMNAAIRATVHYCMNEGCVVYAAHGGFSGLAQGHLEKMEWIRDQSWQALGGCSIQTDRKIPVSYEQVNETIQKYNLRGIFVVGGFDALVAVNHMENCVAIPVILIPATISNNVPGSEYSLGCDTAVNAVVDAIDTCKISADSAASRVFIIETQGNFCGYLALTAGFAGGADIVYTDEEGITLEQMLLDIARIKCQIVADQKRHFVVVRNENCNLRYDMNFMKTLYEEEGKDCFSVRVIQLGHLCQGMYPSPFDRVRATNFACTAAKHLINCADNKVNDKLVIGQVAGRLAIQKVSDAVKDANMNKRTPMTNSWISMLPLQKMLAKYGHQGVAPEFQSIMDAMCDDDDSSCSKL